VLPPKNVIDRLTGFAPGVLMLIGASDTGKSTYARELAAAALSLHKRVAYIDVDVAVAMVAPPACTGVKYLDSIGDLESLHEADEIRFVGSTSPKHLVLQLVVATSRLVEAARTKADIIIVDTSGVVSGVTGETLKYHKLELCRPDVVIGLQRGGELEPLVGMLRRFFPAEIETTFAHPEVRPASPTDRAEQMRQSLKLALTGDTDRWRVRPTVFAPTLPAGLDPVRLQDMLVGVHDGDDRCLGLGVLDYDGDVLRVETAVGEGMSGLRLGSLRIDRSTYRASPVNLREVMFGLD
jgi:polynucleotide 5'-kinase involved in rRNA processing